MMDSGIGFPMRHRSRPSRDPSVEPLSTTMTRAGAGVAAASDSRQVLVSASPFQFTTTTPKLGCVTVTNESPRSEAAARFSTRTRVR